MHVLQQQPLSIHKCMLIEVVADITMVLDVVFTVAQLYGMVAIMDAQLRGMEEDTAMVRIAITGVVDVTMVYITELVIITITGDGSALLQQRLP
jgi:hypothetical protein